MVSHSSSVQSMIQSGLRNRGLILQLTKREFSGRYRGSMIGLGWSFLQPIFMLLVYTFVFSVIFRAKWNGNAEMATPNFALVLFAGLTTFTLFAECVNRAPGLILGHPNYVKKVVFPIEILPVVVGGSAVLHAMASLIIFILASLFIRGSVPWTIVFVPLIWLPLLLLAMGIAWFLAAVGVYLRDVGQVVTFFTQASMFLAPIFYPLHSIPEVYQPLLLANPVTFAVVQIQDVAIWGKAPDWLGLIVYAGVALGVAWLGYAWFQNVRRGFADVL